MMDEKTLGLKKIKLNIQNTYKKKKQKEHNTGALIRFEQKKRAGNGTTRRHI